MASDTLAKIDRARAAVAELNYVAREWKGLREPASEDATDVVIMDALRCAALEISRLTRELEAAREQVRALREALSAALDRASEGETRAERRRPGQGGGLRAIFGRWPGDETDEEIREWLEKES